MTRRYPRLIRRDAAKLWRSYRKYRTVSSGGILPAWAADEYGSAAPRSPRAYLEAVRKLLRAAGDSG